MAEDPDHHRIVLLNRLLSDSVSRAPEEHKPPFHGAYDLLQIVEARRQKKIAIEYENAEDDDDEARRAKNGIGLNWLRLRHLRFEEAGDFRYATLLFEYVDQGVRSFPVVSTTSFSGREIEGEADERGATAAHVVIRMPTVAYDDGAYRCTIELMPSIPRKDVEAFLSRQVRRYTDALKLSFDVQTLAKGKKKKQTTKSYRYHPRFHLVADIGRKLSAFGDGRVLTHMTFIKRAEKQSIGQPTAVAHDEVYADVELKISAKQGPEDEVQKRKWVGKITDWYRNRDFEVRLFYRSVAGTTQSGDISQAVAGAADLIMCPREIISLSKRPRRWSATINAEIAEKMKALLDNDELWQRSKS